MIKIIDLYWFGHGYAEFNDSNDGYIQETTPFLAFSQNFKTDSTGRFRLSDITTLNKNSFYNVNTVFYTCNTGTKEENSFASNWLKLLGGSTQACVNRTGYETIMFNSLTPTISEKIRVNGLRTLVGFCIAGSDRYPIPSSKDNSYWVYDNLYFV